MHRSHVVAECFLFCSLGMVCYEVATRERPFADLDRYPITAMVVNGTRPNIPNDCPAEVANMMRRCWAHDPSDRPVSFEHEAGKLSRILPDGVDPRPRPLSPGRHSDREALINIPWRGHNPTGWGTPADLNEWVGLEVEGGSVVTVDFNNLEVMIDGE